MKSIFNILQDIEKLIYKVLMWVILIPKTIVQITLNPTWAIGYVKEELEKDETPFDEYISPVILLLVVALIPALAFSFLPSFGAAISSPAQENPTTDRILLFEARTDFKSASTQMEYIHTWSVKKIGEDGGSDAVYDDIYKEIHVPGGEKNHIEKIDNNTVTDSFLYAFPESGEYYINVHAEKFDPRSEDRPSVESYDAVLKVTVPVKTEEQIVIASVGAKTTADIAENQSIESFTAQVQKEKTIFLALALMLPPLLFAFATKIFMGEEIGENTLKENFYIQCYYFSPLSLSIWATYYGRYFYTADVYLYSRGNLPLQILFLPPLMAGLWFIRTEMKTIAQERKTSRAKSILIVAVCIALLGLAAKVIFSFSDFQDNLRLFSILAYPVASALLIMAFGVAWYRRRRAEDKNITVGNISWFAATVLALAVALNFLPDVLFPTTPQQIAAETRVVHLPGGIETQLAELGLGIVTEVADLPAGTETQIADLAAGTETDVAALPLSTDTSTPEFQATQIIEQPSQAVVLETPTVAPQPFYIEEFNGDVASWSNFMTSGDSRMVESEVDRGKLSIHLLKREDKLPWYYLINDSFTYADVKVEAVVTNRGNNANGVSLICRYSDIGWYEFVVSNSGTYTIYAVDINGIVRQGYNELKTGGSAAIKTGQVTNVYTAVCKDGELSLFVNQTLVRTITDTEFNFAQGKIGLAVSSPRKLPVNVDIETITVSEP